VRAARGDPTAATTAKNRKLSAWVRSHPLAAMRTSTSFETPSPASNVHSKRPSRPRQLRELRFTSLLAQSRCCLPDEQKHCQTTRTEDADDSPHDIGPRCLITVSGDAFVALRHGVSSSGLAHPIAGWPFGSLSHRVYPLARRVSPRPPVPGLFPQNRAAVQPG